MPCGGSRADGDAAPRGVRGGAWRGAPGARGASVRRGSAPRRRTRCRRAHSSLRRYDARHGRRAPRPTISAKGGPMKPENLGEYRGHRVTLDCREAASRSCASPGPTGCSRSTSRFSIWGRTTRFVEDVLDCDFAAFVAAAHRRADLIVPVGAPVRHRLRPRAAQGDPSRRRARRPRGALPRARRGVPRSRGRTDPWALTANANYDS